VIGEFIAKLALRVYRHRQQRAFEKARFDGVCPECGQQMDFLKTKTEYREGGAYCPGFLFVCHGCEVTLWEPNRSLYKTSTYREL
jgi:hypothetical protein